MLIFGLVGTRGYPIKQPDPTRKQRVPCFSGFSGYRFFRVRINRLGSVFRVFGFLEHP